MSRRSLMLLLPLVVLAACSGESTSPSAVVVPSAAVSISAPPSVATSSSAPATPVQLAEDVDIGGRTLHLFCMGTAPAGTPTVIAESGLTGDSRTWNDLFYSIAARTRLCAYDRAGLNLSQPVPGASRTTNDQVDDLEKLIAAAKLEGPFVMLGHSSGTWNVILYTLRHPDDVAGVVFADPRAPGVSDAWRKALPKAQPDEPEGLKAERDELTTWEHDPSGNDEHLDLVASAAAAGEALDAAGPLFGSDPLVVLSGARTPESWSDVPEPTKDAFTKAWFDGQQALAKESTKGRWESLPDSDHDVPGMRPDAVTAAVFEVIDAIQAQ